MYEDNVIEQVDDFKYLKILAHDTKGLSPGLELLCKAGKRAMFGLQRGCQQLNIQDLVLQCKLFDTLVRPCATAVTPRGMECSGQQIRPQRLGASGPIGFC